MPGVSAGSRNVGAIDASKAIASWLSAGAWAATVPVQSPSARRETARSDGLGVSMASLPCAAFWPQWPRWTSPHGAATIPLDPLREPIEPRPVRLPFFYGWLIVGVAFVTMAVGVNARTAFSLLFPPILDEFGWERGLTAGAFSFGFLVSAALSPLVGRLIDRRGPRVVIEIGVVLMAAGLMLAPLVCRPWHLYVTLGVLVGGGGNCLGYTGQSLFLPNWFVRRRGLAMNLAFSGVGVGSIVLLPWLQTLIARTGWRAACWALGLLVLGILAPLNLLLRHRPADLGLNPDGNHSAPGAAAERRMTNVVDAAWVAVDWTLARAIRTPRFWWIAVGYFLGLFAWYAVQVHQTKYLVEIGFSPTHAAWALGFVSLVAVPGQIALGHLSDRIGREWVWTVGSLGFVLCLLALL